MTKKPALRAVPDTEDTKPQGTRAEKKRLQILAAAASVIAERGYAQTMLDEIARRARTRAGSLYYHFASRDELIEEVLRRGVRMTFERSQEVVAALPKGTPAVSRLEAVIRSHLGLMLVESNYAKATARLIGQIPADMAERINDEYERYGKFLDRLIRAAINSGEIDASIDPSAYRLLIMGAINWAPEWFSPNGRLTAEQVSDMFIKMSLDGIRVKRAPKR